jgi:hypothetical protein
MQMRENDDDLPDGSRQKIHRVSLDLPGLRTQNHQCGGKIMQEMKNVTIETMSDGAAIERANLELSRVLANILDKNTDPEAAREVTLKIKLKPNSGRNAAEVTIQATSKLAPVTGHNTQVYIGTDISGQPECTEIFQADLFPEHNKLTPFRRESND